MIRLARIGMREIVLPLVELFETSAGVVGERRILLLEITDADGVGTWSECVAESLPTYSPDTVDTCWLALKEWIIPSTLGKPFPTPRELNASLERRVRVFQSGAEECSSVALDARTTLPLLHSPISANLAISLRVHAIGRATSLLHGGR